MRQNDPQRYVRRRNTARSVAGEWISRLESANWRNIAISLIDPDFGEQTAQTGENA